MSSPFPAGTSLSADENPIQSLPIMNDEPQVNACCSGLRRAALGIWVVVTIVAIGAAAYFAGQASRSKELANASFAFPPINATASVTSEKYSMATGAVSEEAEGVFVLDHNSGLLQCSVLYPRMGQVMAQFTVNVGEALGAGAKGGSYVMVTGFVDFPRSSSTPAATTVVYVLDTGTGNFACYGIPFDRTAVSAGRAQQNVMQLVFKGTANPLISRDR
jgi:hypothetical protein